VKVVVDTNVFMGAAWGRTPARLLELWREGGITLVISDAIQREYVRILAKTPQSRAGLAELVQRLDRGENIERCTPGRRIIAIEEDPADEKFLEAAVEAGADFIISSDRHLKAMDGYRGIKVLSAGAFLKRFG